MLRVRKEAVGVGILVATYSTAAACTGDCHPGAPCHPRACRCTLPKPRLKSHNGFTAFPLRALYVPTNDLACATPVSHPENNR